MEKEEHAVDEDLVGEAIAEALRLQQEGEALSVEDLLARHPDLPVAELTRRFLAVGLVAGLLQEAQGDAAVAPSFTSAGRRLGDFALLEVLGEGGMGTVYRARQRSTGREVAVKVLPPGLAARFRKAQRFQREIQVAASLVHPGIVQVYGAGEEDGCLYYAMELVQGADLGRVLARAEGDEAAAEVLGAGRTAYEEEAQAAGMLRSPGGLDPDRAVLVWWLAGVARALHFAHLGGVVHRDVKPGNILVDRRGRARVADFGLARPAGVETLMTVGSVGTPAYMSPEQASSGPHWSTPATDVYSLGATLYHAVTGRLPFGDDDSASTRTRRLRLPAAPRRIARGVPRDLEAVILRAMDPDPALRPSTAEALAGDLERFLRGEPVLARPLPVPLQAWRLVRRRPWQTALAASLFVAAVAIPLAVRGESRLRERMQVDFERGRDESSAYGSALQEGQTRQAEEHLERARESFLEVHRRAGGREVGVVARLALADLFLARLQVGHARAVLAKVPEKDSREQMSELRRLDVRGNRTPIPEETGLPVRASIRSFLERNRVFPGPGLGNREEVTVADVLDAEGMPGADGYDEVLFPGANGDLQAWSREKVYTISPRLWGEDCRGGIEDCSLMAVVVPAASGRPRRLAVLADLRLVVLEARGNRYEVQEDWNLGERGVFGNPRTQGGDYDPHGRNGPLSFLHGPGGAEWLATGTTNWKESGDKPRRDCVLDLRTGVDLPLTDADRKDGSRGTITHGLAAMDLDEDGVDEVLMARAEWAGYGLTLAAWDGSAWVERRTVKFGAVRRLAHWQGPWFVAMKQNHENVQIFDRSMPAGLPRGLYPVELGRDVQGPTMTLHGEMGDFAFPDPWGEVLSLVVADLAAEQRLALALLNMPEKRESGEAQEVSVLVAYLRSGSDAATPNLAAGRELFRWEGPHRATELLTAGDFDGDGEQEILSRTPESQELLFLGWGAP